MKNNRNEFVKPGGLDLKDRLVSIQRVTKVTKGGRAKGFAFGPKGDKLRGKKTLLAITTGGLAHAFTAS